MKTDDTNNAKTRTRWTLCLHEAAHLVAAKQLNNDDEAAAVVMLDGDAGLMMRKKLSDCRFSNVLTVAAGKAGEALADVTKPPADYQPPQDDPGQVTDATKDFSPGDTPGLRESLDRIQSDDFIVATWCITDHLCDPARWMPRFNWIRRMADEFVDDHKAEIVAHAARLYRDGWTLASDER